jgi:3-hydroxy-9,10-secoandrosta-1,3,5(10)-triene-9,17-dione monooxygenase
MSIILDRPSATDEDRELRADLVGRAAKLVPLLAATARRSEDDRQVVAENIAAIDEVVSAHGASSFAEASPLQRIWRDSEVASRHAVVHPEISAEVYGKSLLGLRGDVTALV